MKPLTAKEAEQYLKAHGYMLDHVTGSHYIWINPLTGKAVPIPHHGNRPIPQGTLISIFKAAGIESSQR